MIDFSQLKSITIPEGEVAQITVNGEIVWKGGHTNLVPLSMTEDGKTIYNGGKGYKDGYRVRSGGGEGEFASASCTGYIPIKAGDVVRWKGVTLVRGGADNAINVFDSSYTNIGQVVQNSDPGYGIFAESAYVNYNWRSVTESPYGVLNWVVPPNASIAFMRLTGRTMGDGKNLIVTVNEEIVIVVGYKNLIDTTPTTDATITTSSEGWLENVRINSSYAMVTAEGNHISNIIKVGTASTLRCKGMDVYGDYGRIYLYKGTTVVYYITPGNSAGDFIRVDDDYCEVLITTLQSILTANKGASATFDGIRVGGTLNGTKDDVIVTLDEEIV